MNDHKSCIKNVATDLAYSSCGARAVWMFNHTGNTEDFLLGTKSMLCTNRYILGWQLDLGSGVSDYLVIMDSFQEITLL